MRREPQRRLVARSRGSEIAAGHVGVAKIGMQFRDRFSRNAIRSGGRDAKPGLVRANGFVDPANGVMVESDAKGSFRHDVGGYRCGS